MKNIIFVLLIFVLVGCDTHNKSVLDRLDDGKTFTYDLGQKFAIQLAENPTTGYMWHFKAVPEMIVTPVEDHFEKSNTYRVGAGGEHVFVYETVNKGETEIQAFHARPWAPAKNDEPTLTYKIIVR